MFQTAFKTQQQYLYQSKNNLTALTRPAVLGVLSSARRLVILFFRMGITKDLFVGYGYPTNTKAT